MPTDPFEYIWPGIILAQAIYAATELRIADLLDAGPMGIEELARAAEARPVHLNRLLQALSSYGIFHFEPDGRVANSPYSQLLIENRLDSRRACTQFLPAPFLWQPLGKLVHTVRTGEPAFDLVFGEGFFDYLGDHPQASEIFNAMMTQGSAWTTQVLLDAYDFAHYRKLVDVGGGEGALLREILAYTPRLKGVLFDQEQVICHHVVNEELLGRCEIVGGDFFGAIPEGGDAYLLNGVLHNWLDDEAIAILRNVRRAIPPDGTLLLLESLVDRDPHDTAVSDLLMMVIGGRERSESTFRKLIERAGFEVYRVIPMQGGMSLIECKPV